MVDSQLGARREAFGIDTEVKVHEGPSLGGFDAPLQPRGRHAPRGKHPRRVPNRRVGDDGLAGLDCRAAAQPHPRRAPPLHHHLLHVLPQVEAAAVLLQASDEGVDERLRSSHGVVQDGPLLVALLVHERHLGGGRAPGELARDDEALEVDHLLEEGVGHDLIHQVAEGALEEGKRAEPRALDEAALPQTPPVPRHRQRHPSIRPHCREGCGRCELGERPHPPL
mmetsp:Transcript_8005/g.26672  ORF Transcript_8005/g.26672 Transcript_8005/m.26672 type:complete len:224 (-) Transcript_8005:615-1286(-)